MSWPALLLAAENVSPIGTAAGDIISYILGYGVLGIAAVLFGLGYIVPKGAVASARADLLAENERLRTEKAQSEAQRDEALRIAQEKLVPLLTNFVSVTSVLIPLLQQVVASQERGARDPPRLPGG